MKFGEKVREERTKKGLTQPELGKLVGVTKRTIIGWESGERYPQKRELYDKLASVFGVPSNYLASEDEEFITAASEQYGRRGKRQAEDLVAELSGMFAGGELSDADKDAVMIALQRAYFDCKGDNKKYTPKKYRKD